MQLLRSCCRLGSLLPAALLLAVLGCTEKTPPLADLPPPVVQVANPVERVVTDHQIFTARTQAVESVDIKARVTGYLTKICYKDGAEVMKGDVLFLIDDRPYKAALDDATALVEFSKASLVKAQAFYDIGLAVRKQDKTAISDQQLDQRLGARDEAKASVDKANAQLEQAQLNYGWCKVTAPISGRLNNHLVDVGNLVNQNTTSLINIVSLRPTWAYFDVDENTALRVQALIREGKLKSARTTEIPVQMSLESSKGFPFNGVIDFVSNQVDPNTGSIRVRAVFSNTDDVLEAGLFARIRVPVSAEHPALLVNDQAIGTNQDQKFILIVNAEDKVEYRPVEVGQLFDGLREVKRHLTVRESAADGKQTSRQQEVLTAKDRIIVNGLQRVRAGATVKPLPVDMVTLIAKP